MAFCFQYHLEFFGDSQSQYFILLPLLHIHSYYKPPLSSVKTSCQLSFAQYSQCFTRKNWSELNFQ